MALHHHDQAFEGQQGEQQQREDQGIFGDTPGQPEVTPIPRKKKSRNADPYGDRRQDADNPQQEHGKSGELQVGIKMCHTCRRGFGQFEAGPFPSIGIGQQGAQQPVIQGMAGLMGRKKRQQGCPDKV